MTGQLRIWQKGNGREVNKHSNGIQPTYSFAKIVLTQPMFAYY